MACINCQNKIPIFNQFVAPTPNKAVVATKSRGIQLQRVAEDDLPCPDPVSVPCVDLVISTVIKDETDTTTIATIPALPPASALLAVNQWLANHIGLCYVLHFTYTCNDTNVAYPDTETTQAVCATNPCPPPYVWNPATNTCVNGGDAECTMGYPQFNPITGVCCAGGYLFSYLTNSCVLTDCAPLLWNSNTGTCCGEGEMYNPIAGTCIVLGDCPIPQYNPITDTCCGLGLVFSWITQSCIVPTCESYSQFNPYTGECCPDYFSWLTLQCNTSECPPNQINPITGACCTDGSAWCWQTQTCVVIPCPIALWNPITCQCSDTPPPCTENSPQWNPITGTCCSGFLVWCETSQTCIALPEDCNIYEYSPLTCLCGTDVACQGVLISKDSDTYIAMSIGSQNFTGATYAWSILSGPGSFTTATNIQGVQLTGETADTVLQVVITFLDGTVCIATANASVCDTGVVSASIATTLFTDTPQFTVTATLINNDNLLAEYEFELLDLALGGGQFAISTDGITYTNIGFPSVASVSISGDNYVSFIRYQLPTGEFTLKSVSINPFNGDINTLVVDAILSGGGVNTASVSAVGTTVYSATWVVSGDIEILSGQGTSAITWRGCNGSIVATLTTDCGSFFVEPVVVSNCATGTCEAPTMTLSLVPAFEGDPSIYALIPVVDWKGNPPTNIDWSEIDPNSAVTLTDNGLWAYVEVDTSLIVGFTSVTVDIETDCGDLTGKIPFEECTIVAEIATCQQSQLTAVYQQELASPDFFKGVVVNGTTYPANIAVADNMSAQEEIQTFLNALGVGGVWGVSLAAHGTGSVMVGWVICVNSQTTLTVLFETDSVAYNIDAQLTAAVSNLTEATVLWSNPQNPPLVYTWVLTGVTLKSGTLNSPTIIVSGTGSLAVTVTTTDCGTITPTPEPVTPATCGVRISEHAESLVLTGNTGTGPGSSSTLLFQYKGTGTVTNITVDWGDGTVLIVPYVPNFPLANPIFMQLSHVYATAGKKFATISGTDSNFLQFLHSKVFTTNAPTAYTNYPSDTLFLSESNVIQNMDNECCGVCAQSWHTIRFGTDNNPVFAADVVVSETLRVQGVNYPITPIKAIGVPHSNVMTITLLPTPGTYQARYRTVIDDGVLPPYIIENSFQFITA